MRMSDWSSDVCSSDLLATLVVDQRAHLAAFAADDKNVADTQGATAHQYGRDRATTLVELGLDHGAFGRPIRIGLQLQQFGLQQDFLRQHVKAGLLERRYFDVLNFAAHLFDLRSEEHTSELQSLM